MPDTKDPVAAYLTEVRDRAGGINASHSEEDCSGPMDSCTGHDALRLAAAIEEVQRLAGDFARRADKLYAEAASLDAKYTLPITAESYKAQASVYAVAAGKLEGAVSAALLGESSRAGAAVTGTGPQPPSGPPPDRVVATPDQAAVRRSRDTRERE